MLDPSEQILDFARSNLALRVLERNSSAQAELRAVQPGACGIRMASQHPEARMMLRVQNPGKGWAT